MFRFLHAADIHLDSPQRGLDRYEGAPVVECRGATRRALENLVDLALAERVAFTVIVGDLYDGDWPDYNTGLFFGKQMVRLRDGGIPVFMIRGNHDAANKMTKDLKLVDNVHVLSSQQAETLVLEDLGVAIHGQSFPTQAVLTRACPARLWSVYRRCARPIRWPGGVVPDLRAQRGRQIVGFAGAGASVFRDPRAVVRQLRPSLLEDANWADLASG